MSIYGNPVMLGGGGGGGTGEAFLEAEATTYLNTGVAGNTVYKLRLEFTPITVVNDYQWYCGGANNDLTIASMAKSAGPTSGFIRCGGVDFGVVTFLVGQKNVLVCENGKVTLNGTQLSGTFSGPVNTTSTPIYLFGSPSSNQYGHSRVYVCELYDSSDNLIKRLVPYQDSSYIPCMLDTISNTVIYGDTNRMTYGYKV